ncbi:MAG: LptF/LptG family permease [Phycisphaerae bacterium]|nr:LptF/LptG family permease [Phycisphaerae bacterium]
MIFTLHRYIFCELLKVFVLATVALTLILSLGGILRPVQEYGVGPRQVVHILLYFMPITLTFVLPMAALFASALTYGRFAVDNELDACRASGVSLLTLIYPGFVLALLVAIANLLLSFRVMPYFVHLAEKSMKADARQILFRNIQRKGYYSLPPDGRYFIYADYADPMSGTLFGIVVVQYENERIKRIVTSEATKVQFDPHDKFNEVQLNVYNARQIGDAANDYWGRIGSLLLKKEFGSLLGDKIKFKKVDEVKRIRADLMQFDPIAKIARTAYVQLATEMLAQDMGRRLRASPGDFYDLKGSPHSVRLSATACALDKRMVISLKPPVIVEEYDTRTGERLRRLRCEKAEIYVEEDPANPRLGLDLHSARDEVGGSLLVQYVVADLALPDTIRQSLERQPILSAVSSRAQVTSMLGGPPSSILAGQQTNLNAVIVHTQAAMKSEMNSRLVFGIGGIPMILIGIGLGIVQRGGRLLGAFGASCVPAAVISGKRLVETTGPRGPSGVLVMWAGVAFLVLLTAWIYRRLLRR